MKDTTQYENDILYQNSIVWIFLIPALAFENVVCLIAISTRKRWKSPDVLLFSLVLTHFLTLVMPLLLYAAVIMSQGEWLESPCKFLVWCTMSFKIVNSLQICFLSMDRVWTLRWPGSYRIHNTAKQCTRTVSFIWIFGMSVGTVPILGWPAGSPKVISMCSLILDIDGYGYSLCTVIIILGSFVVSGACVGTIVSDLAFRRLPVDVLQSSSLEFKQPIPEIFIESETGERTSAIQGSRDVQNKQICILVSVMVTAEFLIHGIPFVGINLTALTSDQQQDWMPITVMWCSLCVIFLNPVLLGVISQRYRRSYMKLCQCFGEACGCADSSIMDTTEGGIHRQDTVDSLDNFSDDGDHDGENTSYFNDLSFSIDMDDEHAMEYGITPSLSREDDLAELGYMGYDDYDYAVEDESSMGGHGSKASMSSKERRARWLAHKSPRREQGAPSRESEDHEGTSFASTGDRYLSVDRADSLRDQHRKLQRNTSRDFGSTSSGARGTGHEGDGRKRTLHVVQADIEDDGARPSDTSRTHDRDRRRKHKDKSSRSGRTKSGKAKSETREEQRSGHSAVDKSGDRKGKRRSVPSGKLNSPVRGQAENQRSHRSDAARDRKISDFSSINSSGELYDIPEEEDEDIRGGVFVDRVRVTVEHGETGDRRTSLPDTADAIKGKGKRKHKDKKNSKKLRNKHKGANERTLSKEDQWLKREIEREESSSDFVFYNASTEADTAIGEAAGYVTSPEGSMVSPTGGFSSIDIPMEYDMDMIVIEQVNLPPLPPTPTLPIITQSCHVPEDDATSVSDHGEVTDVETEGAIISDQSARVDTGDEPNREVIPAAGDHEEQGDVQGITGAGPAGTDGVDTETTPPAPGSELPNGEECLGDTEGLRSRSQSQGAAHSSARDMRDKYRRSRSERIELEPIYPDSSQEILFL